MNYLKPIRTLPRLLVCGVIAAGLLVLNAVGCASKTKPPSTVKEFLAQPRPK